jgi:hypothetical protein
MVAARVEAMRRDLAGVISSDENLNQELRVNAEDLLKKPVRQREKRRGSRRFTRFLVAICIGVVGTLAWQSYSEAIKQTIAIRAPEFGGHRSPSTNDREFVRKSGLSVTFRPTNSTYSFVTDNPVIARFGLCRSWESNTAGTILKTTTLMKLKPWRDKLLQKRINSLL